MSSTLGPKLANFYMDHLEGQITFKINPKPTIYCRYIDDTFALVKQRQLNQIKREFEKNSDFKFTIK